ncbi:MAG: hypothetical protein RBR53_07275 [Desulforegulaceae bacterium]|nr:hypothetical protein [Desulforegulaceae bacterium]
MQKFLFLICFCIIPFSFLSARDLSHDKNTFEFNFSQLENLVQEDEKQDFIEKIEKSLLKYLDFNEFTKNNFDKIVKYKFWKKVLIFSEKEFVKEIAENNNYNKTIQNFALVQVSEDLEKLDEIYNFFENEKDLENKNYTKKQAIYALFNQSENYEQFKNNLKSFKYIKALDSFDGFFPNHSFVLDFKAEIKKEEESFQAELQEKLNKEKKKQIYYYGGLGTLVFILIIALFSLLKSRKAKTTKSDNNQNLSFRETLENAPEMELFRVTHKKIDDLIKNTPTLEDALLPFASDYGIDFQDCVLISEYIQSNSMITVSGIEKLKELCADCKSGVVYSKKEDGFIVLCRKEVD